jgi:hypothetical protein
MPKVEHQPAGLSLVKEGLAFLYYREKPCFLCFLLGPAKNNAD